MTTNLGTGSTGGRDRYVDVPPRAIEKLQNDVPAEPLKKLKKVELIEEYCGRFLVEVHAGRDDQQEGEVETEEERLRSHYRNVQALLTVLEGHAAGMIGNPDVVRDVQGVLLQKLVAITRNIALLSSSGTFATSSSAWALVRTFLELWAASRIISRSEDGEERRAQACRWKAQQEESGQTIRKFGERFSASWGSQEVDVLRANFDEPQLSIGDVEPVSIKCADTFAWVHDTGTRVDSLEVDECFRRVKTDEAEVWSVQRLKTAPQGTVRIRQGTAAPELRGGLPTGTVKWFGDEKGFGFITPDEAGKDLFVHHSDILGEGYKSLTQGAKVEFESEEGPKGPKAKNVLTIGATTEAEIDGETVVFVGKIKVISMAAAIGEADGQVELLNLLHVAVHLDAVHAASTIATTNPSVLLYTILPALRAAFDGVESSDRNELIGPVHESLEAEARQLGFPTNPRRPMPFVIPLPPADAPPAG
jgi:CspA family cold shock protein